MGYFRGPYIKLTVGDLRFNCTVILNFKQMYKHMFIFNFDLTVKCKFHNDSFPLVQSKCCVCLGDYRRHHTRQFMALKGAHVHVGVRVFMCFSVRR